MSQTIVEETAETIAESIRQASRATGAITDAIEDGVGVVRHAAKQGCDAAEEFLNNTPHRLQRHLALTVAATFAVGAVTGALMAWMMKRK
jgi:ElaB/YqjD/DUF883 family membrane-anchored ribosome-binding protein